MRLEKELIDNVEKILETEYGIKTDSGDCIMPIGEIPDLISDLVSVCDDRQEMINDLRADIDQINELSGVDIYDYYGVSPEDFC